MLAGAAFSMAAIEATTFCLAEPEPDFLGLCLRATDRTVLAMMIPQLALLIVLVSAFYLYFTDIFPLLSTEDGLDGRDAKQVQDKTILNEIQL